MEIWFKVKLYTRIRKGAGDSENAREIHSYVNIMGKLLFMPTVTRDRSRGSQQRSAFLVQRYNKFIWSPGNVHFASSAVRWNSSKKIRVWRYMNISMLDSRSARHAMQRKRYKENNDETPPSKVTVKMGFSARA